MSVEVSRERTPKLPGQLHRRVRGVVHPGPGREHGARHQDDPLEVRLSDHRRMDKILYTRSSNTLWKHDLSILSCCEKYLYPYKARKIFGRYYLQQVSRVNLSYFRQTRFQNLIQPDGDRSYFARCLPDPSKLSCLDLLRTARYSPRPIAKPPSGPRGHS